LFDRDNDYLVYITTISLKRSIVMEEISKIVVEEFEKKPDGSWVSVKNSDILTSGGGVIRIAAGVTFKKGRKFVGFDIAEVLDQVCANQKN
jgi:hypothetical protein